MQCPACKTPNLSQARFCVNCGEGLPVLCAHCGTVNPAGARYCMNCGTALQGSAVAEAEAEGSVLPTTGLSTEIPTLPQLNVTPTTRAVPAEKARQFHPTGERRVVTVLFADVVGSTSLAEQMDPEDWAVIMNRAFDMLTPVVYHYEGTVARLMGDAILAFFGAPVAHEDDPIRAAHAALDMIAAARSYAEQLRPQAGIDFAIRVGINTGPVVVGDVGSQRVYEYTAMGDAVNLAARIQAAARPMTVFITENTYRLVAPAFECAELGPIPIKGKAEQVRVYEVLRARPRPVRRGGPIGSKSLLVGRTDEMANLLRLTQALLRGVGQAALVFGEPGIGKSRLVEEWQAQVEAMPGSSRLLTWAMGRCLSYGQGLAFHLLVDLLRSLLNVPSGADEEETAQALRLTTQALFGEDGEDISPYLGHLLSLPLEEPVAQRLRQLDPQELRQRYLLALRRFLLALAARRPLALVLEDMHWADPSSVELLIELLPICSQAAVLFCFVTRPEQGMAAWKLVSAARRTQGAGLVEIRLGALTQADSDMLVTNLLDTTTLPEKLRHLILAKAEGNPLFVEEVIRMLEENGTLVQHNGHWQVELENESFEIPDNLQSLLLARIDRLPEDVRHTLRVAAVIGRQFSVRVLEEVLKKQQGAGTG